MKTLMCVFITGLILVDVASQVWAEIEYNSSSHRLIRSDMQAYEDDNVISEKDEFQGSGEFSSDLELSADYAQTHVAQQSDVFMGESQFIIDYQGSGDMRISAENAPDYPRVCSSVSLLFTISSPCNYQLQWSKTGSIGQDVLLLNMDSGEYLFRLDEESSREITGQITTPGRYIFAGGFHQNGVEGQYVVDMQGTMEFEFNLVEAGIVGTEHKTWADVKSLYR